MTKPHSRIFLRSGPCSFGLFFAMILLGSGCARQSTSQGLELSSANGDTSAGSDSLLRHRPRPSPTNTPAPTPTPSSTPAAASSKLPFMMGVNIHSAQSTTSGNQTVANILNSRKIGAVRMDLFYDNDFTNLRDQVARIRANGGTVEGSLQVQYQWDSTCYSGSALTTVENTSYHQTANVVNQLKDIIHDYELLNEVQLRTEMQNEVAWNTAGTSASAYSGKPCYNSISAVLRGMSRAIHDIAKSSGLPLRAILGVVGRDYGFLTYEQQQGVVFDVVGYHIYPRVGDPSLISDPWFGTGGPLAQLAAFGKPVHINEFHCGEIYDSAYTDQPGNSVTEDCYRSLRYHMQELIDQKIAKIESVHVYELLNEPTKSAPESNFGLMYDLSTPKIDMAIISAFAGGALSSSETSALTSRGLFTSAQIQSFK